MTAQSRAHRLSPAGRRVGYLIGAVLAAAFWYGLNVWPDWSALSFLTEDTAQVLGLVNLSLAVSLAANLVYVGYDEPWFRSLGDVVTTGVGLAAMVRVWQVFPFDFTGSFDWALVVRAMLVVGIAGSVLGILVNLAGLARRTVHHSPAR